MNLQLNGNKAYELPFMKIGLDVYVWSQAKILSPERISIGDSVVIDDFVFLMGGEETTLGSFIHIGTFSSLVGGGELVMEDFSGLSSGVRLFTGNEDYLGTCLTNPAVPHPYRSPLRSFVHIKKHAIVGANSVILPGITIGEGVVIGASSLVTKDCAPWTIYAGCPVRALKERPSEKVLELEERLRTNLYDSDGHYIPHSIRSGRSQEAF